MYCMYKGLKSLKYTQPLKMSQSLDLVKQSISQGIHEGNIKGKGSKFFEWSKRQLKRKNEETV